MHFPPGDVGMSAKRSRRDRRCDAGSSSSGGRSKRPEARPQGRPHARPHGRTAPSHPLRLSCGSWRNSSSTYPLFEAAKCVNFFVKPEISASSTGWTSRLCGAATASPGVRSAGPRKGLHVTTGARPRKVAPFLDELTLRVITARGPRSAKVGRLSSEVRASVGSTNSSDF